MRGLGSKLLAGGLSAGVILLWWPTLFSSDTPVSWLVRGVAWTLMFEVLLLATMPFELALWDTHKGARIASRVDGASRRLHHEDPRRRLNVRGGVALFALALPLALLGTGAQKHLWLQSVKQKPVTHVTKVVKVVRPVEIKRVVKREVVVVPGTSASGAALPNAAARSVPAASPAPRRQSPSKQPQAKQPQANTNEPGTDRQVTTLPASPPASVDQAPAAGGSPSG